MSKRQSTLPRQTALGSAVALLLTAAVAYKAVADRTAYTVTRVIDGDTFETAEKQHIRINGVQAPEAGNCWYDESKKSLESMILNKKVYLKVIFFDKYRRQIANVYLPDGTSVARKLAQRGSVYVSLASSPDTQLLIIGNDARSAGRGIFSDTCTQMVNPTHPQCTIKANITSSGNPTYHLPGCKSYTYTKVQLYLGDRWFCNEAEARKAGFIKAATCP